VLFYFAPARRAARGQLLSAFPLLLDKRRYGAGRGNSVQDFPDTSFLTDGTRVERESKLAGFRLARGYFRGEYTTTFTIASNVYVHFSNGHVDGDRASC